jgi:hypothetical protein
MPVQLFKVRDEMEEPDKHALVYDLNVEEYTNEHRRTFDRPLQEIEELLKKDPGEYKPKSRAKKR